MVLRHSLVALCVVTAAVPAAFAAPEGLATVSALVNAAKARTHGTSRVALGPTEDGPADPALRLHGPDVPNVVRAMGVVPGAPRPMADMLRAVFFEGSVATSTRAAIGLRIAQMLHSPYLAAHTVRVLEHAPDRKEWREFFSGQAGESISARQREAVTYAELLTSDIHGVDDERFARLRQHYTDSEIVELTIAVAFFNHLARFVETARLPVEAWAFEPPLTPMPLVSDVKAAPRIGLISDREIAAMTAAAAAANDAAVQRSGLGLGLANSMRAMFRAPGLALPWRALGTALREHEQVGRDVKLQVSLAVSTMNGCRYCVRHQVLGLRRIGVDPARLVALQKDDTALTPRERIAVLFARQVTAAPTEVGDADWARLSNEFGERGALEVLLQTCTFAFMNRFTDGLMLPSEDEAIKVYQETYGAAGPIKGQPE